MERYVPGYSLIIALLWWILNMDTRYWMLAVNMFPFSGRIDLQHSFARSLDVLDSDSRPANQKLDVFISYRRSTGSQLARYGLWTHTMHTWLVFSRHYTCNPSSFLFPRVAHGFRIYIVLVKVFEFHVFQVNHVQCFLRWQLTRQNFESRLSCKKWSLRWAVERTAPGNGNNEQALWL